MPDYLQNERAPEAALAPTAVLETSVRISKVSNGFIIMIGCKTFVMRTWKEVNEGLTLYWKDPNAARMKYCEDDAKALTPRKRRTIGGLLRNRRRKIGRRSKN